MQSQSISIAFFWRFRGEVRLGIGIGIGSFEVDLTRSFLLLGGGTVGITSKVIARFLGTSRAMQVVTVIGLLRASLSQKAKKGTSI